MINKKKIVSRIHDLVAQIEQKEISSDSLAAGRSAIALLYFYYGDCFNKPEYAQKGLTLVEEIFNNLEEGSEQGFKTYDLFSGLTGMLAVLVNIKNNNLLDIDTEILTRFDKLVYEWAMTELDNSNIDFFYGATGVLSYFKEQKEGIHAGSYMDCLVKKIVSLRDGEHAVIINRFYNQADKRYEKEVNFSLAHGMVSLLNCLLDLYQKGFNRYNLHQYITECIEYIISISEKSPSLTPHCFVNALNLDSGKPLYQKRVGWCFSDLNILHLLYKGATTLNNDKWRQLADKHAATVAARVTINDTLVDDPFICHGSAGLFQYYHSLYGLSGQPVFLTAAKHWLQQAMDQLAVVPDGHYTSKEFSSKGHIHSLFYGLTGVGLSLISAFDPRYSSWSAIIML